MLTRLETDFAAEQFERHLGQLLDRHLPAGDPTRLAEAIRYALLGGGKRLRPFLLVRSAALFGVPEANALNAAAALECVHCYSLVHDDLPAMDDDALRRGRPTVHVAYDEATAILVGDALLTLGFRLLSEPETHPDPEIRNALVAQLAEAAGLHGMVGGQARDLAMEGAEAAIDDIAAMQAMKTGALFGFACEAGAILGSASRDQRRALADYADALGQAFQLADDLLDTEGDVTKTGKAVSKDAARGKATIVGLLGAEAARHRLNQLIAKTEAALRPFGNDAETLIALARYIAKRDS